jgi:myo-inositol-1(or 4)-monophosphatase
VINSLSARDLNSYAATAESIARKAGAILLAGFNKRKTVKYKGRIDPVTQYDLKSERHIVSAIRATFPSHRFLAEEGTASSHESPFRWIIDPLDGTVNFAHGFPVFCVSIALEFNGEVVVGVVYDPIHDELFRAIRNKGALLNKKRIRVSYEKQLEKSLIATGFAYDVGTSRRNNIGYFSRMVKKAQAVRRPGSAALDICWVACGRFDGFWELKLHPWDTAAAYLILLEAGGKSTKINGSQYTIFDGELVASNGTIHKAMLRALARRS